MKPYKFIKNMDNCFDNISIRGWKFQIPQKKSDQFSNIKTFLKVRRHITSNVMLQIITRGKISHITNKGLVFLIYTDIS